MDSAGPDAARSETHVCIAVFEMILAFLQRTAEGKVCIPIGSVSDLSPGRPTYDGTKAGVCIEKLTADILLINCGGDEELPTPGHRRSFSLSKMFAVSHAQLASSFDNHAWGGQVATERKFGLRPETDPHVCIFRERGW